MVKKYVVSHATLGTRGEVQTAIARSLELTFVSLFVPMKLLSVSTSLLQVKLQFDSTDQLDYLIPSLNCRQQRQFHQCFSGFGCEIVI